MAAKKRFDAIQTLRFLCFLMVFGEHAGFYKVSGIPAFGESCAMSVFLMMSGFLMVYSYMDRETESSIGGCFRFTTGKLKKLYPLHVETATLQFIMFIILYWSLFVSIDQVHLESQLFRFGVNLSLMQAWVPDYNNYVFNFNGPSWFLSVMLFAYFLFPLILKLLKKLGSIKKVLCLAVIVSAVFTGIEIAVGYALGFPEVFSAVTGASFEHDLFIWFTQNSPIMRVADFFIGCVMGYIYMARRKESDIDSREFSKVKWTIIEVIAFALFYFVSYYGAGLLILSGWDLGKIITFCSPVFSCVMSMLVLLVCIYSRGYISKALSWKPLVYLGNISMYTYLIHYIFTQGWAYIVQANGIDDMSNGVRWIAIVVEFALTIVCSVLYDKLQKKKAAKAKAKKEAAAAAKAEAKAAQ